MSDLVGNPKDRFSHDVSRLLALTIKARRVRIYDKPQDKYIPVTVTVTLCQSPSDTLLDAIFSVLVFPYWLTTKCS